MEYNPKIAKACPYQYYWLARFSDREEVAQYSINGEEVLYREVLDRLQAGKGLSFIAWIPTQKGKPTYVQYIDSSWQRPIVLRRHFVKVGVLDGEKKAERTIFLLGWQATINGRNYKSILFIDSETGNIEVQSKL